MGKNKGNKFIVLFSRVIVGATFMFSGFVKGIDPWGFSYKFTDYFHAMHLDWLTWAAFPLAILLSFAEFTIGAALFFNAFVRFFSWLALLFMAFFLPLTFWIALKNPVTDCGCFGDALVITNWETFYKNVVLIVLALIVFLYRKNIDHFLSKKLAVFAGILAATIYVALVFQSYNHLPIIDFRPYKVGVNIPEAMQMPADAPQDVYENTFFYKNKNTGKIEKFTEENYPWQDTANWVYNDMKSKLVQKGYEPPIHDFSIESPEGENITDFFTFDSNYVFMLVTYNLKKSSLKSQPQINDLAEWAQNKGFSFICLTSSIPDEYQKFANDHNISYDFFNSDEITLKTIIRSNPGLVVLKNGTIIAKYHFNDIPTPADFEKEFMSK